MLVLYILHNYCECNDETVSDDKVVSAIAHDKDAQSTSTPSYRLESNETEGKRVRRVLTKHLESITLISGNLKTVILKLL